MKLTDSVSADLLAAAADKQAGGMGPKGYFVPVGRRAKGHGLLGCQDFEKDPRAAGQGSRTELVRRPLPPYFPAIRSRRAVALANPTAILESDLELHRNFVGG
jgi:hypothetical protein